MAEQGKGPAGQSCAFSPMEHYNITEFLRGQSSKILTQLAKEDTTAYIQKNGKPLVVAMSNARYERLMKNGININEY